MGPKPPCGPPSPLPPAGMQGAPPGAGGPTSRNERLRLRLRGAVLIKTFAPPCTMPPPHHFRCFRCHQAGHFANDCLMSEGAGAGNGAKGGSAFMLRPTAEGAHVVGKRATAAGPHHLMGASKGGPNVLGASKRARGGDVLHRPSKKEAEAILRGEAEAEAGVYVLELPGGRFYVGKSSNIGARLEQHRRGEGALCAEGFLRRVAPLTPSVGDAEMWERAETLERMRRVGVSRVRGWMFTGEALTEAQREAAFGQVCERFDLCRRCGRAGHFVGECQSHSRAGFFSQ